jgi:hypothetical protein
MKTTRVSYDRREDRRDRRYPLPPLTINLDVAEYTTVNWSLGGFLLGGYKGSAFAGQTLAGKLSVRDNTEPVAFTGVVVRVDEPGPGNLAVQFTDLDDRMVTLLDRAIARRLFRGS